MAASACAARWTGYSLRVLALELADWTTVWQWMDCGACSVGDWSCNLGFVGEFPFCELGSWIGCNARVAVVRMVIVRLLAAIGILPSSLN